jgi:hypothetical protein
MQIKHVGALIAMSLFASDMTARAQVVKAMPEHAQHCGAP